MATFASGKMWRTFVLNVVSGKLTASLKGQNIKVAVNVFFCYFVMSQQSSHCSPSNFAEFGFLKCLPEIGCIFTQSEKSANQRRGHKPQREMKKLEIS